MKKIAIITGASSGLGEEFIRQMSGEKEKKRADEIWAIARRKERLEALSRVTDIAVRPVPMDLTLAASVSELELMLKEEEPEVHLLINAAGFGKIGNYSKVSRAETDSMIDLNCRAAVDVTLVCLPYMTRGSRIMEICSTAAFQPIPYLNTYAATKAFLYRYTRALRYELKGSGIKVTAVCPYWVKDTEFIPVAKKSGSDIRSFPLASRKAGVVSRALRDSRMNLPVSTPSLMCLGHRFLSKFIPGEALMAGWDALRRV